MAYELAAYRLKRALELTGLGGIASGLSSSAEDEIVTEIKNAVPREASERIVTRQRYTVVSQNDESLDYRRISDFFQRDARRYDGGGEA